MSATSNSRAEVTARRREAMLAAALELFDQKGIEGTTLEEVRVRAGVSVGSLYHHFSGKEQLVDALRAKAVSAWSDAVLGGLERSRSPRSGLRRAMAAHIEHVGAHPALTAVMLSRAEPTEPDGAAGRELARANRVVAERLGGWLGRQVAKGEVRALAPELYATIIVGPCLELARLLLAGRVSIPPSRAADQLADLIWRAISA